MILEMLKIKFALKNCGESEKLFELIDSLQSNPDVKFIFRGENTEKLMKVYATKHMEDLAENVFLIGEKGKQLYHRSFEDEILQPFDYVLQSIDDIGFKGFEKVCTYLKDSLDEGENIEKFKHANKWLIDLVNNKPKRNDYFNNHYSRFSDNEKKEINALLLTIAHTIGAECNSDHSLFLSTSRSYRVAKDFSNGIIFFSWYPGRQSPVSNTYIVGKDICEKLKQYDIEVNGEVFPKEREISLLYGMMPHFLIGILDTVNKEFWVNPAIQEIKEEDEVMVNEIGKPVWSHGLYIDQANFIDQIEKTKLHKYAELINGSIFPDLHTVFEKQSAEVAENE